MICVFLTFFFWFIVRIGEDAIDYMSFYHLNAVDALFSEVRDSTHCDPFGVYRRGVDLGIASSMNALGLCLFEEASPDPNSWRLAADLFRRASENGCVPATSNLAICYRDEKGVAMNIEEAQRLFRQAGELGSPYAHLGLGIIFSKGIGVPKDVKKAFAEFKLAADQGLSDAMYEIGCILTEGPAEVRNILEAVEQFKRASSRGCPSAMSKLADCYENGIGVEQNSEKAKALRRMRFWLENAGNECVRRIRDHGYTDDDIMDAFDHLPPSEHTDIDRVIAYILSQKQ